jgi:DNA-binding CsgD family transcriptional regulator
MNAPQAPALTELEYRVLRLSATGLLTHEVADQLGMDPDEVRRHVTSAMATLGARSKLEAVVLALRWGLIELPAE